MEFKINLKKFDSETGEIRVEVPTGKLMVKRSTLFTFYSLARMKDAEYFLNQEICGALSEVITELFQEMNIEPENLFTEDINKDLLL